MIAVQSATALLDSLLCPNPPRVTQIAKEGDRSYYVCAETAEDMKKWMNAMSLAAIQYAVSMLACLHISRRVLLVALFCMRSPPVGC